MRSGRWIGFYPVGLLARPHCIASGSPGSSLGWKLVPGKTASESVIPVYRFSNFAPLICFWRFALRCSVALWFGGWRWFGIPRGKRLLPSFAEELLGLVDSAEHRSKGHALAACDVADRMAINKMSNEGAAVLGRELGDSLLQPAPVLFFFFKLIGHQRRRGDFAGLGVVYGIELADPVLNPRFTRGIPRDALNPRIG